MEHCDILIIGSGAAGISAAKMVAQENANIWLVDAKKNDGRYFAAMFPPWIFKWTQWPGICSNATGEFPEECAFIS